MIAAVVAGAAVAMFVCLVVGVAVAMERADAATADRPGNDDQWADLVPVMRSVRRHRRHVRRGVRRA